MISTRALAVFIAAFALLASALIAVPFAGTGAPSTGEALGASDVFTAGAAPSVGAAPKDTGSLPGPVASAGALGTPVQSLPGGEADETSVPRLWLGSPMVR
jgi:hypothetical protein